MPAKKKSAKTARKSVKMRDLKPSKDAKGGVAIKPGVPGSRNPKLY
jgi:hypothetical protein